MALDHWMVRMRVEPDGQHTSSTVTAVDSAGGYVVEIVERGPFDSIADHVREILDRLTIQPHLWEDPT